MKLPYIHYIPYIILHIYLLLLDFFILEVYTRQCRDVGFTLDLEEREAPAPPSWLSLTHVTRIDKAKSLEPLVFDTSPAALLYEAHGLRMVFTQP